LLAVALVAATPSVAALDANARASGNDRAIAVAVGRHLFITTWPVQVLQVIGSDAGDHVVIGLRLSGVKFHGPTARSQFEREILALVGLAFAEDPRIEEVDLWTTVPLTVGKGLVVTGDLAQPTTRTVFSLSARRSEGTAALERRLSAGTGIFLDPQWAAAAFMKK
jgi:hypothetical protein